MQGEGLLGGYSPKMDPYTLETRASRARSLTSSTGWLTGLTL